MRRQPDSTPLLEVATDGGWGATPSQESADEATAPDGWHHPLYDQRHTAANLNAPARPVVRSFFGGDAGWISDPLRSTSDRVTTPLVTSDHVVVGVEDTVVVISREDGGVLAEHRLPATIAGLAQKPDSDVVVAVSDPVEVGESTAESAADSESQEIDSSDGGEVEPGYKLGGDGSVEAAGESESGDEDPEAQSSEGETTAVEEFESGDAIADVEGESIGNTHVVSPDELCESAAVPGINAEDVDPKRDWAAIYGIDLVDGDVTWRRFTELGADTLEGLRFPVFADRRCYVPNRPVVSSGGAGRDVGEIGGFDIDTGEVGGYVSYPYQDFNATPRGPPLISVDGDFHFHAGGKAGEVVRVGTVLSRPAWQSYVGVPGKAEWQPLLSEGILVVPGNGGQTVGVNAETGDVEWASDAALADASDARAAAHGGFFFAADDSTVRCLLVESGTEAWTTDLAETVAPDDGGEDDRASPTVTSVVVGADTVLAGYGRRCIALDVETGSIRWVEKPFPDAERIERIAVSDVGLCLVSDDGRVAWAPLQSAVSDTESASVELDVESAGSNTSNEPDGDADSVDSGAANDAESEIDSEVGEPETTGSDTETEDSGSAEPDLSEANTDTSTEGPDGEAAEPDLDSESDLEAKTEAESEANPESEPDQDDVSPKPEADSDANSER